MNPVVHPISAQLLELAELTVTPNLWFGAKLHLFKNNIALTPALVLGDLVEADFTGYAASSAITWGTPFLAPGPQAVVNGDVKTFTGGATFTVPNTIYGWYITNSGGTVLYLARSLDTPVNITATGQACVILPAVPAFVTE